MQHFWPRDIVSDDFKLNYTVQCKLIYWYFWKGPVHNGNLPVKTVRIKEANECVYMHNIVHYVH